VLPENKDDIFGSHNLLDKTQKGDDEMSCVYAYKRKNGIIICQNKKMLRLTKKFNCRHVNKPYQCVLYQRKEGVREWILKQVKKLIVVVKNAVVGCSL
jgi:hypothetical protein